MRPYLVARRRERDEKNGAKTVSQGDLLLDGGK